MVEERKSPYTEEYNEPVSNENNPVNVDSANNIESAIVGNKESDLTETVKVEKEVIAVDATLEDDGLNETLFTANELTEKQSTATRVPENIIPKPKIKKVLKADDINNDDKVIFTVRGTAKSVYASLERYLQTAEDKEFEDEDRLAWLRLVQNAQQSYMISNDQLFEATVRNGSVWVNMLNYGTEDEPKYKGIVSDRKGFNPRDKNDNVAIGITKALSSLGLGIPNYVPLYHTGIWVRLRTPSVQSFINLEESLVTEKVRYGAITRGDIFSNEAIIYRKHIVDFILDHIEWTNAPEQNREYLKETIKAADLSTLMLGIMQNRYPEGYPFTQTCTVDPNTCTHTVEGMIDLRELLWVDKEKLSDKQKQIMNNPRRVISEEELQIYQDEFKHSSRSKIILERSNGSLIGNDEEQPLNCVVLNIDPPTLNKDEEYGVNWVNELVANAENIFREKYSEEERAKRMAEEVAVSYFKTYGSWVQSIEVYEAGNLITRLETQEELDTMLSYLSGDATYVDYFRKLIHDYINKNTVSLVGILNYECPNCGKKHDTPEGNFHIVLPIDVLYTFFTLVQSSVKRSFQVSNM